MPITRIGTISRFNEGLTNDSLKMGMTFSLDGWANISPRFDEKLGEKLL